MFEKALALFRGKRHPHDLDEIAKILSVQPELLKQFEDAYNESIMQVKEYTGSPFDISASQAKQIINSERGEGLEISTAEIEDRIVNELIGTMTTDDVIMVRNRMVVDPVLPVYTESEKVTNEDLAKYPVNIRPQLTGDMRKADISEPAYLTLLDTYMRWKKAKTAKEKETGYNLFRQGLDILDLDPVLYAMLGTNRNRMSYWLPSVTTAAQVTGFFKIPDTTVVKIPLSILQLTRLDYGSLTRTSLNIVDKFCSKMFQLDAAGDYFVKTGVYSSKFDFRNCHVTGEEIKDLGEYLLFIQNQATMMAGPLMKPCIYGVSTTNEWVVRDFIRDTENNPCIYKGLPLRTEYRMFIDADTDEVLGIAPYWEPEMLKKRFSQGLGDNSPHSMHDYIIIREHEEAMMKKFNANKDRIVSEVTAILPYINIEGQWSLDIMQNGSDFYIIDMAQAANSALKEYVPEGKLKPATENWLPEHIDF